MLDVPWLQMSSDGQRFTEKCRSMVYSLLKDHPELLHPVLFPSKSSLTSFLLSLLFSSQMLCVYLGWVLYEYGFVSDMQ